MFEKTAVRSLPFFIGPFLTCMCGLMLQIIETRILSVSIMARSSLRWMHPCPLQELFDPRATG
jgi:hypothetical protein